MILELTEHEARVLHEFLAQAVTGPYDGPRGVLDRIMHQITVRYDFFDPRFVKASHTWVEPGEAWPK